MSTDTTQDTAQDDWAQPVQNQVDQDFDEMAGLDLDTEGVDPDSLGGQSGDWIDKDGKYHFEISHVPFKNAADSRYGKNPEFQLRCVVIQSVQGQSPQGSVLIHHLEIPIEADKDHLVGKNQVPAFHLKNQSLCDVLVACGVFIKQDGKVIDPETKSTKMNLRTVCDRKDADGNEISGRLRGKQFIGKVVKRMWENSDGSKRINEKTGEQGFSHELAQYSPVSSVDDPANYGVPMNQAALATIGKKQATAPATNGTGNGKKAAAKSTQQQQTAPQQTVAAVAATASDELDVNDL